MTYSEFQLTDWLAHVPAEGKCDDTSPNQLY